MSRALTLTPRQRMWRAARMLPAWSVSDLASLATVPVRDAQNFVKCLSRRDYIRLEGREKSAHRGRPVAKFRLLNNSGPELPSELRGISQ